MQNLGKTYDDIRGVLQKRKIRIKWCHSGNPLSEAVIGRILWAKNNWQPEWWFPKNGFEKSLFLRKSYEVVSRWLTKDLWKSYDKLRKNLTKFWKWDPWGMKWLCVKGSRVWSVWKPSTWYTVTDLCVVLVNDKIMTVSSSSSSSSCYSAVNYHNWFNCWVCLHEWSTVWWTLKQGVP